MTNLGKKLNKLGWDVRFKAASFAQKIKNTLRNENGDTNFISIIIILAIVLIVAVVFLGFKDDFVKLLNDQVTSFESALKGQEQSPVGG